MYHGMGIAHMAWVVRVILLPAGQFLTDFFQATCGEVLTVFSPQSPARIPTPDSLLKAALDTKSDILVAVPTFIEV